MPRNRPRLIPLILDSQTVYALLHSKVCRLALPNIKHHRARLPAGLPSIGDILSPGDCLWVREAWNHANYPDGPYEPGLLVYYRADYLDDPLGADFEHCRDCGRREWLPASTMPREVCRIQLRVKKQRTVNSSEAQALDGYANAHQLSQIIGCYGSQPDFFNPNPHIGLLEFALEYTVVHV